MSARADYISVLMVQSELNVKITDTQELCIFDEKWWAQWDKSLEMIKRLNPDIVVYPETSSNPELELELKELSKNKLIVAGSMYAGKDNLTVVYYNGEIFEVPKNNPSPLEVAACHMDSQSFDSLVQEGIRNEDLHIYKVKGKDVIVLNCMEYYNSSYFIARSGKYNKNLFGFISPCSSSNMKLFEQETIAINNHKEGIYSFVCNRISPRAKSTTKGGSYIYGAISRTAKEILQERHKEADLEHVCGIVKLGSTPQWVYGEYAIQSLASPFGRSDDFKITPREFEIGSLI